MRLVRVVTSRLGRVRVSVGVSLRPVRVTVRVPSRLQRVPVAAMFVRAPVQAYVCFGRMLVVGSGLARGSMAAGQVLAESMVSENRITLAVFRYLNTEPGAVTRDPRVAVTWKP